MCRNENGRKPLDSPNQCVVVGMFAVTLPDLSNEVVKRIFTAIIAREYWSDFLKIEIHEKSASIHIHTAAW